VKVARKLLPLAELLVEDEADVEEDEVVVVFVGNLLHLRELRKVVEAVADDEEEEVLKKEPKLQPHMSVGHMNVDHMNVEDEVEVEVEVEDEVQDQMTPLPLPEVDVVEDVVEAEVGVVVVEAAVEISKLLNFCTTFKMFLNLRYSIFQCFR